MNKRLREKINSNKGFTLVELIVVIAIIAIITVGLAPQFVKYVEQSREATDKNTLMETVHAAEVAYIGDGKKLEDNSVKISIATDGKMTYPLTGDLDDAVEEIIKPSSYEYKSKMFKGKDIIIDIDENGRAKLSKDMDASLRADLEDLIAGIVEGNVDNIIESGKEFIEDIFDAIIGGDEVCDYCTDDCSGCTNPGFMRKCGNCKKTHYNIF